ELTRDIAERFNERFGQTFKVPVHRIPEIGARIMDLQDPTAKMSTTSASDAGRIYVTEDPASITKKVKSAVTDSGSDVVRGPDKPGITNLIDILAVIRGVGPEAVEADFDGKRYGDFKTAAAEEIVEYLRPVREAYDGLRGDEAALNATLADGAERARAIASETVARARDAMGVGAS
ncbi:MAG TPA: tryptophan--tRNA ligase, partial [Thermoanaerobaculia bacterium]|nr:tryptophan--tRNA ligase [Thermoanaerobaculia bacterium]